MTTTHIYYHGSRDVDGILEVLLCGGTLRTPFHMTPDIAVAKNYGKVIAIEIDGDLTKAHIGMINKDGNMNKAVGNGIEVVLKDHAAVVEFFDVFGDAYVLETH